MAKRDPSFYYFKEDLKLVFRDNSDIGRIRKSETPGVNQLLSNIDQFTKKWSQNKILTEQVLKEIHSLKRHISKGCLSGIGIGQGTNRNENLHRMINLHFSHNRLGAPLALALLAILLHKHNSKIEEKNENPPLRSLPIETPRCTFGIVPKERTAENNWLSFAGTRTCNFSDIDFEDAQYKVILNERVSEYISLDSGLKILRNAMCSAELANAMKKSSSKSPLFNFYMIPFMSPVLSLFFHGQNESADTQIDQRILKRNQAISSFGLTIVPISGDGNCCFASVVNNNESCTSRI